MSLLRTKIKSLCALICLSLALPFSSQALAQTGTVVSGVSSTEVVLTTIEGIPNCVRWMINGVCFWLKCYGYYCEVETSMRISHFNPDLVVSSYHDPLNHPWMDYGKAVSKVSSEFSQSLIGSFVDSAGTRYRDERDSRNNLFRDGDAIGNPAALILKMMTSGGGKIDTKGPTDITLPGTDEMMNWPSTIPDILNEWATAPAAVASTTVDSAKDTASLNQVFGQISRDFQGAISSFSSSKSTSGQSMSDATSKGTNVSNHGSQGSNDSVNVSGSSSSGMKYLCPTIANPWGVYYQSHLDSWTWRNLIPIELVYAGTWIPGLHEVGNFPFNTWGNVYPRTGIVTQQHTVKGAAMIVQRIAHFVTRKSQAHIYKALVGPQEKDGMYYTHSWASVENDQNNTLWQRVYPDPSPTCQTFGINDSSGITTWGDSHTSGHEGHVFNFWHRYECCEKKGQFFLFSIP